MQLSGHPYLLPQKRNCLDISHSAVRELNNKARKKQLQKNQKQGSVRGTAEGAVLRGDGVIQEGGQEAELFSRAVTLKEMIFLHTCQEAILAVRKLGRLSTHILTRALPVPCLLTAVLTAAG